MLATLVYASSPRLTDPEADLAQIEEASSRLNRINDITGVLYHSETLFLQVLEGPFLEISQTYGRIRSDPRHDRIVTLFEADLPSRLFGAWEMRFVNGAGRPVLPPRMTPERLSAWDLPRVSAVVGKLRHV